MNSPSVPVPAVVPASTSKPTGFSDPDRHSSVEAVGIGSSCASISVSSPPDITLAQVREWIDDGRVERVETVSDPVAVFNLRVVFSGLPIHVVKNRPYGPLSVDGQVQVGSNGRPTFQDLPNFDRRQLEARVREELTGGPVLYYFLDQQGDNVPFEDAHVIRLERLLYPDGVSQHALMNAIFEVAKQLFFLDASIDTLVENVESRR